MTGQPHQASGFNSPSGIREFSMGLENYIDNRNLSEATMIGHADNGLGYSDCDCVKDMSGILFSGGRWGRPPERGDHRSPRNGVPAPARPKKDTAIGLTPTFMEERADVQQMNSRK